MLEVACHNIANWYELHKAEFTYEAYVPTKRKV